MGTVYDLRPNLNPMHSIDTARTDVFLLDTYTTLVGPSGRGFLDISTRLAVLLKVRRIWESSVALHP